MTAPCLTLLGTASIQSYIFRSNKLKENVGASFLVAEALEVSHRTPKQDRLGLDARLEKLGLQVDAETWKRYLQTCDSSASKQKVEALHSSWSPSSLQGDVEILYTGGGNAALVFRSKDKAIEAIRGWSAALLQEAPGLRLSAAHAEIRQAPGGLRQAYEEALGKLGRLEEEPPWGSMYQAQPIFQTCKSTGMAANLLGRPQGRGEALEPLSLEAHKKRQSVGTQTKPGPARKRWNTDFAEPLEIGEKAVPFAFPVEIDALVTGDGDSHVALIHADGNGIGKLLQEALNPTSSRTDADFLHHLRSFSASVNNVGFQALCRLAQTLRSACEKEEIRFGRAIRDTEEDEDDSPPSSTAKPPLPSGPAEELLPLLPLVYGGDDITLLCPAKIGLAVAQQLLEALEDATIWVCGTPRRISACAGLLIMPAKYPFSRAYELCEELCASAKRQRTQDSHLQGSDLGGYLDFHVIMGSSVGSLHEIRDARFQGIGENHTRQSLLYRPWPLKEHSSKPYTLPFLWTLIQHFTQGHDSQPLWPRSRIKGLLQALHQGGQDTRDLLGEAKRQGGYTLPQDFRPDEGGAGYTPLFDAIEMLDFSLRLPPTSNPTKQP